ncbi:hypothetical protein XaC1_161 [Xanthomonas phage XaC1]|nr:hypothetical protein XaC1_161 [Xanthomonas phage XaC1]
MKVLCPDNEMMSTLRTHNSLNFTFKLVPEIENKNQYSLLDYITKISEYFDEYNSNRICFKFYSKNGDDLPSNYMMGGKLSSSYYGTLNVCTLLLGTDTLTVFVKSIVATIINKETVYQYINEDYELELNSELKTEYFDLFNQKLCGGDEPTFIIPTQLIPTLA